jgi:hypothetical protein
MDAIMGSRKLTELCKQADIDISKLPGTHLQRVSKADIFVDVSDRVLIPDEPPPLRFGADGQLLRTPIKLWSACLDVEKVDLFLCLLAMLAVIMLSLCRNWSCGLRVC